MSESGNGFVGKPLDFEVCIPNTLQLFVRLLIVCLFLLSLYDLCSQLSFTRICPTGQQAKIPSSAFCLLLRLFTLRCSERQMTLLLDHKDSPYIRCIGFLYLRYACEPTELWKWIQPYLFDEELVRVRFNPASPEIRMGEYVRRCLFGEPLDYFGTRLPRLPLLVERDLRAKIRQAELAEERATRHVANSRTMDYLRTVGSRVRAQYDDEHNPLAWYDAVIDRVVSTDPDTNVALSRPKFVVTFPDYGNTELESLGDLDLPVGGGDNGDIDGTRRWNDSDAREQDRFRTASRSRGDGERDDRFLPKPDDGSGGGVIRSGGGSGGYNGRSRGYNNNDRRDQSTSRESERDRVDHEGRHVESASFKGNNTINNKRAFDDSFPDQSSPRAPIRRQEEQIANRYG